MLEIKNLTVKTNDKNILNDFNVEINDGEIHAIMGPNGTGKSTLSKVIMACNDYERISGDIIYNGKSIIELETDEISRLGIFLSMQNPISIEGVTNSEFLRTALNSKTNSTFGLYDFIKKIEKAQEDLKIPDNMIHRSINKGASGGERKKNEVLQIKILEPSFIILDELDSGLDIDSLKIVSENINNYIKEHPKTSVLIITHYPRILSYIQPNYVHVMMNGKIVKTGGYDLALNIEKLGYSDINNISENKNNE